MPVKNQRKLTWENGMCVKNFRGRTNLQQKVYPKKYDTRVNGISRQM